MVRTIEEIKNEYPEYQNVSDLDLASALYNKYYSDSVGKNDFLRQIGLGAEVGNELTRGIRRGVSTTAALVGQGVPAVGKGLLNESLEYFGFDAVTDPQENLQKYKEGVEEAYKKFPPRVPSFRDIENVKDANSYLLATIGEQIPQMGLTALGGGVGGAISKQGIKKLAQRNAVELTEKEAGKVLSRGIFGGGYVTSASQTVPESYFNLLEQGEDRASTSVALGALKSGLDVLPQLEVLKKILGPRASDVVGDALFARVAKQGVKTGVGEGVTEATQEGIDILAEKFILDNQELFSPENIDRLIEAGLKGTIGGGVFGAGAAPFMQKAADPSFDYDALSPKQKAELDAQFSEEVIDDATKTGVIDTDPAAPLDDTIISPTYFSDEVINQARNLGVREESLNLLSPIQGDRSVEVVNRVNDVDLNSVYSNPVFADPNITPSLQVRQAAIKDNQRFDTDFLPGDGEIVVGAVTNPEATVNNPQSYLQVPETAILEDNTVEPVRVKPPTLPTPLANARPRYRSSQLNFASDLDRAAYIASNPKPTKNTPKYVNWLKEATGLPEAEIKQQGKEIRQAIKEQDRNNPGQPVIDVPSRVQPKSNRLTLPAFGNIRDDLITPRVIHNNLKGIDLSPNAKTKNKQLINQARRIVGEVTGNKVDFLPFENLTDFQNNPVAGAQYLNVVSVAFNETTAARIDETAYHEAYHALENMGAFKDKDLQVIDNASPTLLKYLNEDDYLRGQDFDVLLSTPTGRQELRANAFGKWALEQKANIKNKDIPTRFKNWFRKAQNILERLGNAYKGLGFNSYNDIFESVLSGEQANNILDDINYNNRITRFQRIGEEYQQNHQIEAHSPEAFQDLVKENVQLQNETWDSGKQMGMYGRFIRSMHDAAHNFPALTPIYTAFERREKNSSFLMSKYIDLLGDFTNLDNAKRHRLHDIAAYMRKTGQKAQLDGEGKLTFERDGQTVRLNDPELSQQYVNLQNSYKEVLRDRFNQLRTEAFDEFQDVLVDPNFGPTEVRAAIAQATDETTKTRLNNLLEALIGFEQMDAVDYAPAMRFGNWGITVRDNETGEQVAFYTVEDGTGKQRYDKFQLNQTLEDLQKKYSDSTRYDIIGDKGKITDLSSTDNLVPFLLNKNAYANKIDSRFLNFEMLGSLLNKDKLDTETYDLVKKRVYNDILNRGFKRHFLESQFLDGYSTDWNRVQHAYLSSAGHHIASVPFTKELSIIEDQMEKVKDKNIRERAKSYIDYNNSPAEDLAGLRTFNFLWTMGGNVSTAALQLMTLPTTTLAGMSQFDPNPIANMARIGKWFKVAVEMAPRGLISSEDTGGLVHLAFDDPQALQRLINKGTIDQQTADLISRLYKEGKTRGLLTEEALGSSQFETRSLGGKARKLFRTVGNATGAPITIGEQLTRFATTMAMHDLLRTKPKALSRAKKVYGNNPLFQAKQRLEPNKSFVDHAAEFQMDEAHAVFGKVGRPEFMRSYGGALVFPFMTYPQQAIEFLIRMLGRGPEGRRGAYMMLSTLFLFSGLMGLPGGELLKELLEEVEKQATGSEEDFDLLIREKIYDATGDARFAKFVTQGIGRGYGDVDIARRVGLPIPGQEILLNVLGIRGQPSDVLGVSGSLISGIGQAWNDYQNGASGVKIASSLLPVAPANTLKALSYGDEGVATRRGVQLLTPDEVSNRTIAARAIGITTDQIATKREEQYLSQLLETRHRTALDRFRAKAKSTATKMRRARIKGDFQEAKALQQELRTVIMELRSYAREEGIPVDIKAFMRSVNEAAQQRIDPRLRPSDVRKVARKELPRLQEVLGIEN